ncbi:MAG: hypothetical protein M5U01_08780 [Ardenticatenaceae bacterium]|nr:hypothetical protein [Ardenticatenaceae bacterium]
MVRFAPHSPILLVVLAVATLATACPRPQPPIMPTATFQGDVAPTLEALATQNAQLATEMRRHDLELRGTIEALATQSASMATRVPRWEDATSYLLTQVPAQGRVSTVAALATQNAYLSTQVAELFLASGTPMPPPPNTATPGPRLAPRSRRLSLKRPPPTPAPATSADEWVPFRKVNVFELQHPREWEVRGGGIDFADIFQLGPLKLLIFSAIPRGDLGGSTLTPEETFARFRNSLIEGATITETLINGFRVDIIRYSHRTDHAVYTEIAAPGTVALWQRGEWSYALIDEGDQLQQNGGFDRVLQSFQFVDSQP